MSAAPHCPYEQDEDVVHAWTAGTLDPAGTASFEAHLLECVRCQTAVEAAVALRAALRQAGSAPRVSGLGKLAGSLAVAAVLALLLLPSLVQNPLRRLGEVERMPAFSGEPLRAAGDSSMAWASDAMAAYERNEYRRARDLLRRAVTVDSAPGVLFFLGVLELRTGWPERARLALRRVSVAASSPYAAEARLYLAKAWLRLEQPDSALAALAAPGLGPHALALADSIRRLLPPR